MFEEELISTYFSLDCFGVERRSMFNDLEAIKQIGAGNVRNYRIWDAAAKFFLEEE